MRVDGPTGTDELIRQVTVECGERGLLLLRIRDEIRMTLSAYQVGMGRACLLMCCGWSRVWVGGLY
jgi:hypothetical protein